MDLIDVGEKARHEIYRLHRRINGLREQIDRHERETSQKLYDMYHELTSAVKTQVEGHVMTHLSDHLSNHVTPVLIEHMNRLDSNLVASLNRHIVLHLQNQIVAGLNVIKPRWLQVSGPSGIDWVHVDNPLAKVVMRNVASLHTDAAMAIAKAKHYESKLKATNK
jgi:hypothetical protein